MTNVPIHLTKTDQNNKTRCVYVYYSNIRTYKVTLLWKGNVGIQVEYLNPQLNLLSLYLCIWKSRLILQSTIQSHYYNILELEIL